MSELTDKVVAHWKKNRRNLENDNDIIIGPECCAYCVEYNLPYNDNLVKHLRCLGCPIYCKSGYKFCAKTPYDEIEVMVEDYFDETGRAEDLPEDEKKELLEHMDKFIQFLEEIKAEENTKEASPIQNLANSLLKNQNQINSNLSNNN